jgi:hypothetical protein
MRIMGGNTAGVDFHAVQGARITEMIIKVLWARKVWFDPRRQEWMYDLSQWVAARRITS